MLFVSYARKNAYSAGKTSGVLRGIASGANRCYVLRGVPPCGKIRQNDKFLLNPSLTYFENSLQHVYKKVKKISMLDIQHNFASLFYN